MQTFLANIYWVFAQRLIWKSIVAFAEIEWVSVLVYCPISVCACGLKYWPLETTSFVHWHCLVLFQSTGKYSECWMTDASTFRSTFCCPFNFGVCVFFYNVWVCWNLVTFTKTTFIFGYLDYLNKSFFFLCIGTDIGSFAFNEYNHWYFLHDSDSFRSWLLSL